MILILAPLATIETFELNFGELYLVVYRNMNPYLRPVALWADHLTLEPEHNGTL